MVLLNNARPPRSPRRKGEKKMVAGSVHPLRDISWTAVMQNSSSGNRDILAKADKAENSTVELWGGPHSHHEESCQWGFAFGQTSVYKHGNQKLRNIVFFCWGFSEGLPQQPTQHVLSGLQFSIQVIHWEMSDSPFWSLLAMDRHI